MRVPQGPRSSGIQDTVDAVAVAGTAHVVAKDGIYSADADGRLAKSMGQTEAVAWLLSRADACERSARGHRMLAADYRRRAKALQKSTL